MTTKTVNVRNAFHHPAATLPQAATIDRAIVDDGDVLVWDSIARHFTRGHYLTPAQIRSARARWTRLSG